MPFYFKQAVYLLSGMSTAVFALGVVALASVVGTVFLQGQSLADYQNVFGVFWAEVFVTLGLNEVYTAPWYLLLLMGMLSSVGVCLGVNGPRFVKLWRRPRRVASLAMLRHWPLQKTITPTQARQLEVRLLQRGFVCQLQTPHGRFYTRAPWGRAGYFLSHIGVLVLAVGGLLTALMGFRGVLHLPAQTAMDAVWVQNENGGYAQRLPFTLANNGFDLVTYPDGTPRRFTTHLVFTNPDGQTQTRLLEVNAPLRYRGYSIYQSSFGDAGSRVKLLGMDLATGRIKPLETAVHQQNTLGEAQLFVDDARMHETRHLPQTGARDVGPSVDVTLTWPDRRPHMLRLYLNHPDIMGVAQKMTAEGDPVFATVPLGLSLADPADWALYLAVRHYIKQHPGVEPSAAIVTVGDPLLAEMLPQARITHVARTLQALEVTQNLDLPWALALRQIDPAYYTSLQVAYDPGFWWFVLGGVMLVAGVFIMVYAEHWRVWLVPQKNAVLLAAHAARHPPIEQELWAEDEV